MAVTSEVLDRARNLEVVFVPSAGTDAIDVPAATERGVAVVNAAGVNHVAVAEHALGLLLAISRHVARGDRAMHAAGRWQGIADLGAGPPGLLHGRRVGVIGYGFAGRSFAHKCTVGLGMEAVAYDPYFHPVEAARQGVTLLDDLDELLATCDVVSLHTALTPATRGLIGRRELELMRPTAILVNTSRGGTVDTTALVDALREGWIAGAALDVTDPEPLPDGHPLFSLDNVVLTPHTAGVAIELIPQLAATSARQALQVLRGERPRDLVNPEVWPRLLERKGEA